MNIKRIGLIVFIGTLLLSAFFSAPIPLAGTFNHSASISADSLLRQLAREESVVRAVWTTEIVEMGKKQGLTFDERWREPGHESGPLPALLLRDIARQLDHYGSGIGLSLASDFPIHSAHYLQGEFAERFTTLKIQRVPQFFYTASLKAYTLMLPDVATDKSCISCHNNNPKSPKHDWQLHDVMGAITWTFPHKTITVEEFQRQITLFRQSICDVYELYLEKTRTFASPPSIGKAHLAEGYTLPDADTFMQRIIRESPEVYSVTSLQSFHRKNIH